jgi:hypothetical protein
LVPGLGVSRKGKAKRNRKKGRERQKGVRKAFHLNTPPQKGLLSVFLEPVFDALRNTLNTKAATLPTENTKNVKHYASQI